MRSLKKSEGTIWLSPHKIKETLIFSHKDKPTSLLKNESYYGFTYGYKF